MDVFSVEENEDAAKRENGIYWPPPHTHVQHECSKTAYRTQSHTSDYPYCTNKNNSSKHQASLETDPVKSMRLMLDRAMGRASSTLSPGHRHFATQTKELIAEIELLEEEVTNREQHVLSMYRCIFENCVSQAPSDPNSGVASPAHTKQVSRKHPSIISSAFCSSKKLPLRPLQALVSIRESAKISSKASDAPSFLGKSDIQFEKTFDCVRAEEQIHVMEKSSMLRTLKDHLYQCPSKLSEEMVRCMAAVYCWLHSTASVPGKNRSPLLSRSSTNLVIPRHDIGQDRDWSCKSTVEISWKSTDRSQLSSASYAINNYRVLVKQMEKVTVHQMENNAQIAFWINVYNALAYLAYGIPRSSLRRLALFHKAAYNIGSHISSANAIEQSIFGFRTPELERVYLEISFRYFLKHLFAVIPSSVRAWLETILSTALRKKSSEERQLISSKFGLSDAQPLVCFALCTGAFSDPVLKVYKASSVKEEMEVAKREFLQTNTVVKKSRKVFLPKLLERFAKEASINSDDLLEWITENVDKKLHDSIKKCSHRKSSKKASQIIEWLPYSSRFQYIFSKELTEKPWWV
uniref:DUF547 domain-containing protein n=1 Tax=Manihot esculenta TaxID=3983 RepID=A0A2C9WC97_MANES